MNHTKTFTPLSEIPKAIIGTCSGILPNHMQCWRAGDVQVHMVIPGEGEEAEPRIHDYQLCRAHAIAEKQEQDVAVAAEAPAPSKFTPAVKK